MLFPSALNPTPSFKPLACTVVSFFAERKEPKKPVENNDALFSTGALMKHLYYCSAGQGKREWSMVQGQW